jgi:hypothetical protein
MLIMSFSGASYGSHHHTSVPLTLPIDYTHAKFMPNGMDFEAEANAGVNRQTDPRLGNRLC